MSKTTKKAIIISSKFFWITKELLPYFNGINGVQTHIYKKNVFLNMDKNDETSYLEQLFSLLNIYPLDDSIEPQIDFPSHFTFNYVLPPELTIPEWNWLEISVKTRILLEILLNNDQLKSDFVFLMRLFLSGLTRSVRVIGNEEHPLKVLMDSLINFNTEIEQVKMNYHNWITTNEGKKWGTLDQGFKTIPYHWFVHLFRYPMDNNQLINQLLKKALKNLLEQNITFFVTDIPLLEPLGRRFPVVQCLSNEEDLSAIEIYWKIFSSLILRTLGYSATKMSLIKQTDNLLLQKTLLNFEKKIKSNLDKYIDTFVNPSVIGAYKSYRKLFEKEFLFKRYSEFYSINRGGILESRYRKAMNELQKDPKNPLNRKRANRRRRFLSDFLLSFFEVFGYVALEGLDLFKFYASFQKFDLEEVFPELLSKLLKSNLPISESRNPYEFPTFYKLDFEKMKFSWIIELHQSDLRGKRLLVDLVV